MSQDNIPDDPSQPFFQNQGVDLGMTSKVVSLFPLPSKQTVSQHAPPPMRELSDVYVEKARKRQEVFLQKRRATKKRRVFYNRLKILLRLAFCLILTIGLYTVSRLPIWYLNDSQVNIQGGQLLTPAQFKPVLASIYRQPLYAINPLQLEAQFKHQISLLDHVYIRRHLFPTGLTISVTEKPVWGMLYPEPPSQNPTQPLYLLHWDGTRTDLGNFNLAPKVLEKVGHPIVIVAAPDTVANPAMLEKYRDIAVLLNSSPQLAKLQYLDVSNPYDMKAYFDGFLVRIGQANKTVMPRLSRLFKVMPEVRSYQPSLQWVDLRWDQQIIFKRKPITTASKV